MGIKTSSQTILSNTNVSTACDESSCKFYCIDLIPNSQSLSPNLKTKTLLFRPVTHCLLLDFCLTVHHQLGKVIQMNQLDATVIY